MPKDLTDDSTPLVNEELDTGTDETEVEESQETETEETEEAEELEASEDAGQGDGDFLQPQRGGRGDERIAEVTARMSRLEQLINQIATQSRPAEQPTRSEPARPDRYAGNPNTKQWADFVTEVGKDRLVPEIQRQINETLTPLQRQLFMAQETVDDMNVRRKFPDYGKYEAIVNDLRAQWYRDMGQAVPREYAYFVAKGQHEARRATAERTQTQRKAAKPSAKTSTPSAPTKKAKVSKELTLDSIANMNHDQITKLADDLKLSW